jgi:hypothetical protein
VLDESTGRSVRASKRGIELMGRPQIDSTAFGSITIEGAVFEHDVVIAPDGAVTKRKKKLSKPVYGSSHTISLGEIEDVLDRGRDADELTPSLR